MKELDPKALFRLSVLGPLLSRPQLSRGELKATLRELAAKEYDIPGSRRRCRNGCTTTAVMAWKD
jgi:putative transposase